MKKTLTILCVLLCLFFSNTGNAQDQILGEIRMFAGNFAPRGWALCNGQLLPIASNEALFSIIGTTYGGDGRTTFALPDLRGRVPMHYGQGTGSSHYYRPGDSGGTATNTLTISNLPAHNHSVNAVTEAGNSASPTGNFPAGTKLLDPEYSTGGTPTTMHAGMIGTAGGNQPVNNMQPYQTVTFIIATVGIYPSRS